MATSTESDRYSLPLLQFNHGNVLIKLGHEESDWLVVHDQLLSKASPCFKACLRKAWKKTIGIDKVKHPRTRKDVKVKILALKCVEGAFFLEGKEFIEDLDYEAQVFQDTFWSNSWPHSMIGKNYRVSEMTKRAFRILFATIYGEQLTAEQVAGRENISHGRMEGYEGSWWINEVLFPQIVTVCATAEYVGCLDTIGPVMMVVLHSTPRYWQAVAYRSLQHMKFAIKLRNREVFYDAYKHALAQAYYGGDDVDWQAISDITGASLVSLQRYYGQQFQKMGLAAENLRDDLHRLQISRKPDLMEDGVTRAQPKTEDEERYAMIARSIFGQWLAQHLYLQETRSASRRMRNEHVDYARDADEPYAPALRFNIAVRRLGLAAASSNPASIFGLSTPSRFASTFRLGEAQSAEQGIREALEDLVKQADLAIKRFRFLDLTHNTIWEAEMEYMESSVTTRIQDCRRQDQALISGNCRFDAHDAGYSTCLKVICRPPWTDGEQESKVLKSEPLDLDTLLTSQEWMERVFEHFGHNDSKDTDESFEHTGGICENTGDISEDIGDSSSDSENTRTPAASALLNAPDRTYSLMSIIGSLISLALLLLLTNLLLAV